MLIITTQEKDFLDGPTFGLALLPSPGEEAHASSSFILFLLTEVGQDEESILEKILSK